MDTIPGTAVDEPYATMPAPATVRIERILPGPVERDWTYLTESDKRRQWFAAGPMELRPGGYHVMLLDLKAPLAKDSTVPLTLVFQDAKGVESKLNLTVPVGTSAPGGATAGSMMDGHKH